MSTAGAVDWWRTFAYWMPIPRAITSDPVALEAVRGIVVDEVLAEAERWRAWLPEGPEVMVSQEGPDLFVRNLFAVLGEVRGLALLVPVEVFPVVVLFPRVARAWVGGYRILGRIRELVKRA